MIFPMRAGASRPAARTGGPRAAAARDRRAPGVGAVHRADRVPGDAATELGRRTTSPRCAAASRPGENLPAATWQAWHERTGLRIINGIGATELLHIFISAADEDIRPGTTGRAGAGLAGARGGRGRARRSRTASRGCSPCAARWAAAIWPTRGSGEYVRDGWNITGDTYVREPDGYFRYVARADDMIISAGYNIAGPEVEEALLRHPDVVEAAVVGPPGRGARPGRGGVRGRCGTGARRDGRGAARLRQGRAGAVQVPARDRLPATPCPRTATGKLQRFRLRDAVHE